MKKGERQKSGMRRDGVEKQRKEEIWREEREGWREERDKRVRKRGERDRRGRRER